MEKTFLNRILLIFVFALLLSGLHGCREQPEQAKPSERPDARALRIGIIPEQDVFSQKKRYLPLADYVNHKLGISIELVMLPRFGNILNNFNAERLDGAFWGSFTDAMVLKSLQAVPLVRPEYKDGTSTYYGMIFVRKDSGIRNSADMRSKQFVFVDKETTAGYLLPLHYFLEEGIADYHTWFKETYFAGTHEDAIYDVLNKRADIGATKNTVFARFALEDSRLLDELDVLAVSSEFPENGLAMKSDFDQQALTALKDCLLEMGRDPRGREGLDNFGVRRFIETTVADYQTVSDYACHIGLNLSTDQYYNDYTHYAAVLPALDNCALAGDIFTSIEDF